MTTGEKALTMVAKLIFNSMTNRSELRKAGWIRVVHPPLVGNQWIWEHPIWKVQLESDALIIINNQKDLKNA